MARQNKSYKDMNDTERREYRRIRRLKRRIQVYIELGLIVLGAIILIGLTVNHFKKNDSSTEDNKPVVSNEKQEKGLMVSPKDTFEDVETEESVADESSELISYKFDETDSTTGINDSVESPYGILINRDTGEIVARKNCHDTIYPASMTKVMTVLVAAKNISPEKLSDKVVISNEAVSYAYAHDCSTSGFEEGEEVMVKDLFYGTILPSGGDAAMQLAIYVAGDVDSFVKMMNDEVANLGLSESTHFTNPVGIHDKDNYSTVYDIAVIMNAALDNEICSEVLSAHTYDSSTTVFHPEGITISNWFLRRIEDRDIGGTIYGAKTGYVVESGSCATSSEVSSTGVNYICVTAGAGSQWICIEDHTSIYKTYAK